MAACSGADRAVTVSPSGDAASIVDAVVDGLSDPVSEAAAGPVPPDVAVETCTKTMLANGVASHVAVHAYPGKTAAELARVRVIMRDAASVATIDGQAFDGVFNPLVRDGFAAVYCGPQANPPLYASATFVFEP